MKTTSTLIICMLAIVASMFATPISAKTIYYVKTDGTGDGSSWANASSSIQTMIDNSASGDEVWVAKGTYYPSTETIARDARSRTFLIKNTIKIFGGFEGSESDISQRTLSDIDGNGKIDSWEFQNTTILSGDIDGVSDNWSMVINSDNTSWKWVVTGNEGNCYNVVTANSGEINGFRICGGNANLTSNSNGAGINCKYNFKVSNCDISNCYSSNNGGGLYGSILLSKSNIMNCYALANGGGIYSTYSNSRAENCRIINCAANLSGGGIYYSLNYASGIGRQAAIMYSNNIIINCSALSKGGGAYLSSTGACGVYCYNSTITNCSAGVSGGGIYSYANDCPTTAYCYSTYNFLATSATVNCVIANCIALTSGSNIFTEKVGTGRNTTSNNYFVNNLVKSTSTTDNSIDINTVFVKPITFNGIAILDSKKTEVNFSDWHLCKKSPCINGGTSGDTIRTDFESNARIAFGVIDIGAYEYNLPTLSLPISETFNDWTDFDKSKVFIQSANINMGAISWSIVNQKALFNWQTNFTSVYSQPILTYQIDATKSGKVYFRYDMYFQAYAGTISTLGTERLYIEFSTDLVTWSTIATYSNANGTIASQTYKHDISTLAAGKTFFIRFNAKGANSNRIEKWEIDNVIIDTDGLSAINPIQEDKYKYSVINGVLNISNLCQSATIQIFDTNGKILANETESKSANFILPIRGVYIVKVASDAGVENKKIVW